MSSFTVPLTYDLMQCNDLKQRLESSIPSLGCRLLHDFWQVT